VVTLLASGVELATAYVSLTVSGRGMRKDVDREMGKVDGDAAGRKAGKGFAGGLKKSIRRAAPLAGLFAAYAGGKFLTGAISDAADLGETISKNDQIFGKSSGQVERYAKDSSKNILLTEQAALDASGTFGIFGKSAGLTGSDLAGFSTDFTGLASDLASFNNTTPEEAVMALGAGLRGESEPLRRFGVLLDDQTLRNRALKEGIVDTTKNALTPQQRVLAAQAEIMEQTILQQGDAERTQGSLSNQIKILGKGWNDLKTTIGVAFLPIANKVVTFLNDHAIPAIKNFIEGFKNGEGVGGQFAAGISKVGDVARTAFGYFKTDVLPTLQLLGGWLMDNKTVVATFIGTIAGFLILNKIVTAVKAFNIVLRANPIGLVVTAVALLAAGLVYLYRNNETARRIMDKAWAAIKAVVSAVVDWASKNVFPVFAKGLERVGKAATFLWEKAVVPAFKGIKAIVTTQWDLVSAIFKKFRSGIGSIADAFGSAKDGIGKIWGAITRTVAGPIRSVIKFINDKFIGGINKLLSKIPGVSLRLSLIPVPGLPATVTDAASNSGSRGRGGRYLLAGGGPVPGTSPGGMYSKIDNIPALLRAKEWVIRQSSAMRLDREQPGALDYINRTGRLPGFANGGQVGGNIADLYGSAKSKFGGLIDIFRDPLGAVKKLASRLLDGVGNSLPGVVAKGALKGVGSKLGQYVRDTLFGGSGPSSAGYTGTKMTSGQIGAMVTGITGARMTSGYRPGARTLSGFVSGHALNEAADFASGNMLRDFLKVRDIRQWREAYYTPAGPGGSRKYGKPHTLSGVTARTHNDHFHLRANQGGRVEPKVFDTGGTLDPGWNAVYNGLGKREHLTPTDSLDGLSVEGRFEVGPDGLLNLIDGRLRTASAGRRRAAMAGVS